MNLKGIQNSLSKRIKDDKNEMKVLQKEIGTLDSTIGDLKTNLRNISSAIKTLTLGAY